jgi:anthranilate synthase component I
MTNPSMEEVKVLSRQGNVIPVYREILGDLLTPAAAFLRVAQGRRRVFLLESVEGGERLARYSFIGWDPFVVVRGNGDSIIVEEMGESRSEPRPPLDKLRSMAGTFRPVRIPGLPPFVGGGVGYFAYDLVRQFEKLPATAIDDLHLDDVQVMYFSTILAFDHIRHRIHIIANIFTDRGTQSLESKYSDAVLRIEQIEKRLHAPVSLPSPVVRDSVPEAASNTTEAEYYAKVETAKGHIRAGDIFQVVLSQRFALKVSCDPFDIYRALRFINPSPYMFYLSLDNLQLVGASPEMLVKVQEGRVQYGPIAGTRPRGQTDEEDARLPSSFWRMPRSGRNTSCWLTWDATISDGYASSEV